MHVVAVLSNAALFQRRYELAREFIARFENNEKHVVLYVVELVYDGQEFVVTSKDNPRHLQLRTPTPLWHKENLINIGVQELLPKDWKAFAWVDADVEFESEHWALDSLRLLNGAYDVIQLFSHAIDMDQEEEALSISPSFSFRWTHGKDVSSCKGQTPIHFAHPGYAWAMTKDAYNKIGRLYEYSIIGSADYIMAMGFVGKTVEIRGLSDPYRKSLEAFTQNAQGLRVGYVPGIIRHFFHGNKHHRQYHNRWNILTQNKYNPYRDVTRDPRGVLVPSTRCPTRLITDIFKYFVSRKEDDANTEDVKPLISVRTRVLKL